MCLKFIKGDWIGISLKLVLCNSDTGLTGNGTLRPYESRQSRTKQWHFLKLSVETKDHNQYDQTLEADIFCLLFIGFLSMLQEVRNAVFVLQAVLMQAVQVSDSAWRKCLWSLCLVWYGDSCWTLSFTCCFYVMIPQLLVASMHDFRLDMYCTWCCSVSWPSADH